MRTLIHNIKQLLQVEHHEDKKRIAGADMKKIDVLDDAWLLIEDQHILDFGTDEAPNADTQIDANQGLVLPTFVDAHTHLVHAHSREEEFVQRINGLSYAEIAARGGGILNSAAKLATMDEEELYERSLARLETVIAQGTGAIEIKSGYGLSTETELKMLRVIRRLKEKNIIPIKASFLAAHAYPLAYKNDHQAYIDLIIKEMLPRVQDEGLADYMDVFCEKGFFNVEETDQLLEAGWKHGLKPKIHANQLHRSGGIQIGVKHNAISVDHLESVGDEEIKCLQSSDCIPVLLPGAAFFLNMHYQPARKMIEAGLPVCIASDYNPGSCPSGNMSFMMTLACTQMNMTPEEALNACTINGAASLELSESLGTIKKGKRANLIITKNIPSLAYIPYAYAQNHIERVII